MNYRVKLLKAPERIVGSGVAVTVEIEAPEGHAIGIGMTPVDNVDQAAVQLALSSAIQNAVGNLPGVTITDPLRALLKPIAEAILKEKETLLREKEKDLRLLDRLQGPADEDKQREIRNLCLNLGLEPIDILQKPTYSMLEALALRNLLVLMMERVQKIPIAKEFYEAQS